MGGEYRSSVRRDRRALARGDNPGRTCYAPPSPQLDPWCSGPTCQPVTLEIAGSNPVGSAINPLFPTPRPPARTGRSSARYPLAMDHVDLCHDRAVKRGPRSCRPRPLVVVAIALPIAGGQLGFGGSRRRRPTPASRRRAAIAESSPSRAASPPGDVGGQRLADAERADPDQRRAGSATSRSCRSPTSGPRRTSTSPKEVAAVLAGTSTRYEALELVEGEADAILAALGPIARPTASRLIEADGRDEADRGPRQAPQAARVPARRRGRPGRPRAGLGRAGALRRRSRHGHGRLAADRAAARGARRRRLRCRRPTWTLFAGGDIMLDRGVYRRPAQSRARVRTSRSMAGRPTSPAGTAARRSAGSCRRSGGPGTRARSAT